MPRYRYPGTKPFTIEDKDVFHGRRADVEKVRDLLLLKRMLLLYAESGMGKSSLVNAGLIPTFHEKFSGQKFVPIRIRFGIYNPGIEQDADSGSKEYLLNKVLAELLPFKQKMEKKNLPFLENANDNTLWHEIKLFERNEQMLLLVFDQVEEVFTYPREQVDFFKEQVFSVFTTTIPKNCDEEISSKIKEFEEGSEKNAPESLSAIDKDLEFIYRPLNARILFVVREDKLGLFNSFTNYFPDILKDTYKLGPLSQEAAQEAIVMPAQQKGQFASPKFTYTGEALDKLLKSLEDKDGLFDPFSVQLNCRYVERTLVIKNGKSLIEAQDIPEESKIINDFLESVWSALPKLKKRELNLVKKTIEEKLIDFEREKRVNASQGAWLNESTGKVLLDEGLIKKDSWGGVDYIELSHDRLVMPLIDDYRNWKQLEQATQLKQQATELEKERNRLDLEKRLKEKARKERANAVKAKEEADAYSEVIMEEQKKSKKYLLSALICMTIAILGAAFLVFTSVNLRKQKNKFKNVFSAVLVANAVKAYENGNDIVAFNLAWTADSITGNNSLDSLLEKWNLMEYSGRRLAYSNDLSIIACLYEDNVLQIFANKDSVRNKNPSIFVNNVMDAKLSEDGTILYTRDTSNRKIYCYHLRERGRGLELKLFSTLSTNDKIEFSRIEILDENFFYSIEGVSALKIFRITGNSIDTIQNYNLGTTSIRKYFFNKMEDALYMCTSDQFATKDNVLIFDLQKYSVSTMSNVEYVYNFGLGETVLFDQKKLQLLSLNNSGLKILTQLNDTAFTKSYLVNQHPPYVILECNVMSPNPLKKPFSLIYHTGRKVFMVNPLNKTTQFLFEGVGRFVGNKDKGLLFIKDNYFRFMNDSGFSITLPIKDFPETKNQAIDYFKLTSDKHKIICYKDFPNVVGIIELSVQSRFMKSKDLNIYKEGKNGLYYLEINNRPGIAQLKDKEYKDKEYWRSQYEPLTYLQKKFYGIIE